MQSRRSAKGWAISAAALLLLTGCSGNEERLRQPDAQTEQIHTLKSANDKLETQLAEANAKLSEADAKLNEMNGKLTEANARLSQLQAKAEQEAEDPYAARTENDMLVDKRIPAEAAGLLLEFVQTVNAKPKADDQVWGRFFHEPLGPDNLSFLKSVLAMPELAYGKLFYQGQTTYKKPGKTTVSMVIVGKLKQENNAHAFALTNTNGAGWVIVDVD